MQTQEVFGNTMLDDSELQAMKLAYESQKNTQKPTAKPQKKTGRGGFLSSLIGEAGGAAGAVGGAAIGTAVLPGVGTVIGAGLGGLLGGGAGSAAEQKVRDDKVDWKKAATEGLVSGATSAIVPGGAGKLIAKGGQTAANAASQPAKKTIISKLGKKIENTGGQLMNNQTNLTRAEMRKVGANAPDTFNTMAQQYNLGNLDDIASVSQNVTGKSGIYSEGVRNAIGNGKGIDTADIKSALTASLDRTGLKTTDRKNIEDQVSRMVQSVYADQPLNSRGNPLAAFDVSKNLRQAARDYSSKFTATGDDKAKAKVYNEIADTFEKKLYSQEGVNDALPTIREQMSKSYADIAQKVGTNTPQGKAYLKLADEAKTINNIEDLRTAQKPFVTASKLDQASTNAGGNAALKLGGGGGPVSRIGNSLMDAMGTPVGRIASRAGKAMQGTSSASAPVPTDTSLLSKFKKPAAAQLVASGVQNVAGPASPDVPVDLPEVDAELASVNDPLAGNTELETPAATTGYPRENLLADIQRDPANAAEYIKLFETLESAQEDAGLNSTTASQVAASSNANNTLQQLEGLFNNAGGGSGKVGGTFQNLLSKGGLNNNTQIYNDLANSSVTQVARALNGGGQVSDADAAVVIQALPKITDSPEVAKAKFNALRERLINARQNTLLYNGADPATATA